MAPQSPDGESDPAEAPLPDVGDPMPPLDFTTFVLSLSTSALMHLGIVRSPDGGNGEPNFSMARQTIDLIGLLHDKTKGNLTGEEERILHQVLFDLRMQYTERAGRVRR